MSKKKPKIHVADEAETDKYGKSADSPEDAEAGKGSETGASAAEEETAEPSIEQLQTEVEQWKDKFLRAKADYRNFSKRSEKERNESMRFANADFARSLLTILDDFERTFDASESTESAESVAKGLRIIYDHFLKLLRDRGVEPIEAEAKVFDPFEHEAVGQESSDECPAGTVMKVQQRGYRMHERVLRPARVVVSSGPAGSEAEQQRGKEVDEEDGDAGRENE
jgi:molecular chaperone GrpE